MREYSAVSLQHSMISKDESLRHSVPWARNAAPASEWITQARMLLRRERIGAGGGGRTHTAVAGHEILSLARLPVPPLQRVPIKLAWPIGRSKQSPMIAFDDERQLIVAPAAEQIRWAALKRTRAGGQPSDDSCRPGRAGRR